MNIGEIRSQFLIQIGECASTWGLIENQVGILFGLITGINPVMSRTIFYSVLGFDGRARMVEAANKAADYELEKKNYVKKLMEKTKKYARSRNLILHGEIIYMPGSSKYPNQMVITQGKNASIDPLKDNDAIRLENLKMTAENFQHLVSCFMPAIHWNPANPDLSPPKYLRLIQQLPTHPHRSRLA